MGFLRADDDGRDPTALVHVPHHRTRGSKRPRWGTKPGLYGAAYLPLRTIRERYATDADIMWLGIDIGTGGIARAAGGRARAGARRRSRRAHEDMRMERPLWAEQRPENWWDAAVEAIRGALAQAGVTGARRRGIGLSGQMHGLVLLDAADQVIRPSLIWCDQRSQPQVDCDQCQTSARENVLRYTANPVLTGFTLPKLLWVRDNEPRQFRARAQDALAEGLRALPADRRVMPPKFRTLPARRSSTWCNRRWSYEMMDAPRARPRHSARCATNRAKLPA